MSDEEKHDEETKLEESCRSHDSHDNGTDDIALFRNESSSKNQLQNQITTIPIYQPKVLTTFPIYQPQPKVLTTIPIYQPQPKVLTTIPLTQPKVLTTIPLTQPKVLTTIPLTQPKPKVLTTIPLTQLKIQKANLEPQKTAKVTRKKCKGTYKN